VGCGRVGFDAAAGADADGVLVDGVLVDGEDGPPGEPDGTPTSPFGPCDPATPTDQIELTGTVVRLTSFDGTMQQEEAFATVIVDDADTDERLGSMMGNVFGNFGITIASDGRPRHIKVRTQKVGLIPLTAQSQRFIDGDAERNYQIMNQQGLEDVYDAVGASRDDARATVAAYVLDCDGTVVSGVQFAATPDAGAFIYTDDLGVPSATETETQDIGIAWLFNVADGALTITATHDDKRFAPVTLEVVGGEIFGATFYPLP
jgi:hypothetical protein